MSNPGFYLQNGQGFIFAPNFVVNSQYQLHRETHDQHEYPVDGWYWFDSEEEARAAFGLPPAPPTEVNE